MGNPATHIPGDIHIRRASCCTDHMLQGFSRLCLQISPAAPDCHLESHCAKGGTYICPSLSPFHFLSFQFGISHCSELGKSIYKGLKDMAKLRLDVSLHGVNVGSYDTSLRRALFPGWFPWLSKAGDVLKCRDSREGCRKTRSH